MKPTNDCPLADIGFCPACSVADDIQTAFRELLTAENPRPRAHVLRTEHAEAIARAWTRIAEQFNHPGVGIISLTWNSNFLVISDEV